MPKVGKISPRFEIDVPFDYSDPKSESGPIYYEFGKPYQEDKPTVFILSDAQQFYIRKGEVANFQERWFGDDFNVLGIVGRGTSPQFIEKALGADGKPDWLGAWKIFNYKQFLGDIESVRNAVLGDQNKVMIYGESGGAMLSHQYLAEYGQHVSRAFTRAAVHPFLVDELGLNSDRFWKEIGEYDPELHDLVNQALDHYTDQRAVVVMTLQRQNFFVTPGELGAARAKLIQALANGDEDYFAEVREKYEVDAVTEIMGTNEVIPIRVRLFEFLIPSGSRERLKGDVFYPDYEVQVDLAKPLLKLYDCGEIPPITYDFKRLHSLDGEVFILSGRWDHVVDYRTSIALAGYYPNGYLFLADDDHMFKGFEESNLLAPVLQSFFLEGIGSDVFHQSILRAEPNRWREA